MTRETKIGLLVGLAFIIVVAILLTDHTSSTTSPRSAVLPEAANTLREAVAAPPGEAPPISGPRSPIPTRAQIAPPEPEKAPIRINPPAALPPLSPVAGKTDDLLARHPEDFVVVPAGPKAPGARPAGVPIAPPKIYVAESGDSISRIASKAMGSSSKANQDALVKANPSLQGEGAVVYAGRSYVIPSPGAAQQAAETPRAPVPAPPAYTPPAPAPGTVMYTVRENDNLWRIAARELGDGNLWMQIRDLNRDVLRGGETVRAQMRIRLPKGAATASLN